MNLIYLVLTILLISVIATVEMSYLSVSGIKSGQERNNYLSYISSVREDYSHLLLSDGTLDNDTDKNNFMIEISGDDLFKSPLLVKNESGENYICIERLKDDSKVSAAKEVVKMKPDIAFFISDCENFETKAAGYDDGDYIAFFLE